MPAFEKYEQMRKAAEAARTAPAPETAAQQTRRLIEESGALRAGLEIQAGLGRPFNRVVEGLDGSVEFQSGTSEYDYQSVHIGAGENGGTIRVRGANPGYYRDPYLWDIHHASWDAGQKAGHDRVETEVASAFISPEKHHTTPPPRPDPTPPPPPEKPRSFLRRLVTFGVEKDNSKRSSDYHDWYDSVKDIRER